MGEGTMEIVPEEEDGRIGQVIGNLQLAERIGVGGMGAVYRGQHRVLETSYAVKILHPSFSEDRDAVERFRTEAIASSRLRHPNVVFVTDFGFNESLGLYIVMEYLEGFTLKSLIRSGNGLSPGRMVHLGKQICSALAAAHRLDIVHRDIKPENIMVLSGLSQRDDAKILDFGISCLRKQVEEDQTAEILGTPQYMAPEQITGNAHANTPSVDIYALGMVFYAMLVGRPAFDEGEPQDILEAQLQKSAPHIGQSNPHLAATKLETLVAEMLQKTPERRPRTLDDVQARLDEAIEELVANGVAGSVYAPPSLEREWEGDEKTAVWTGAASGTIRMTTVIKQIRSVGPRSAAAVLLDAIPSLETLKGEALCLALWGVIQQDLLEHEDGTAAFQLSLDQLVLLVQAILESNDRVEISPAQHKIFRVLRSTLPIFDDRRRRAIKDALRPLAASPHYPSDLLDDEMSGSWQAFKKVMTTEIHFPWPRGRERIKVEEKSHPSSEELASMNLMEKLQQDVSLRSINALLFHELTLFGSPKEPEHTSSNTDSEDPS